MIITTISLLFSATKCMPIVLLFYFMKFAAFAQSS